MWYRCLVLDSAKFDHGRYNQGDSNLGFRKFTYTLLLQYVRLNRSPNHSFYVYLDRKNAWNGTTEEFLEILNNGAFKEYGVRPFRLAQQITSDSSVLLQMADIISGAIAYRTNLRELLRTSAAPKKRLSEFVRQQAGLPSLATPCIQKHFNIWHFSAKA